MIGSVVAFKWTKRTLEGVRVGKRGRGAEGKALVAIGVNKTPKGMGRIRLQHLRDASDEKASEDLSKP